MREWKNSASIRITFTYNGVRRRETLDIPPTPSNIKYAIRLRAEIINAIERKTFDYATYFPKSKHAGPSEKRVHYVTDLIDTYIDTARQTGSLSPSSIATYVKWNRSRLAPEFQHKIVTDLTTFELRAWVAGLVAELSPKSIRNCVGLLSSVLKRALEDGILQSNPLAPINLKTLLPKRRKASEEDKIDPFNAAEIQAILGACKRIHDQALFQFAFSSGLRTGELIALKWRHIDWIGNTVRVEDNIVSGERGTAEKTTKTDLDRDVPLLPAARAALEMMRPITAMLNNGDYVFSPDGKNRWRNDLQIRSRWTIALKLAKVRYRNPYQTRHTFASTLLMNGEPELLVAKILGHATVEMVRRHYGRYIAQPEGIKLKSAYSDLGGLPRAGQLKSVNGS